MTKYMTMKQAFECREDDVPFIKHGFNDSTKSKKSTILHSPNYTYSAMPIKDALSDKWQVIKAEPKVLELNEIVDKSFKVNPLDTLPVRLRYVSIADLAEKNGQLREWNRTKELREAVKNLMKQSPLSFVLYEETNTLADVFKNLKPPYQQ